MKIQTKLIITFVLAGIILMLAASRLIQFSLDKGMVDYLNQRRAQEYQPVLSALAVYYEQKGSWHSMRMEPREFYSIIDTFWGHDRRTVFGQARRFKDRYGKDKINKKRSHKKNGRKLKTKGSPIALLDDDKDFVFGGYKKKERFTLLDIKLDQQIIGYLAIPRINVPDDALDLRFIKQQQRQFIIIAVIITASAIALALLLAQHFVRPIKQLATLTDAVANGDYSTQSQLKRKDELGELSLRLNSMTQQLKLAEDSRRRWVADFSHELRTPLAILRGEIEAIIDGVRDANKSNIQSLYEEVQHLQTLIDDLYQLSNADAGEMQYKKDDIDIKDTLQSVIDHHQERFKQKNIDLQYNIDKQYSYKLWADETRLQQLFDNLLNNSFKYTDDNGRVEIYLRKESDHYVITINDSAPGVSDADLPKLFDYLYRTEASRNRKTGGSGLGLAICARIVNAHNGTIKTEHASLGGLAISMCLPVT